MRDALLDCQEENLQGAPGGTHEIPKDGNVGAVRANSSRIHGKSEPLGEIQVHASVIEFRKAEPLGWQYAIQARRIDRPRWTVTPPRTPRHFVELLPIVFVPSRHAVWQLALLTHWMRGAPGRFAGRPFCALFQEAIQRLSYSYTPAVPGQSIFLACCIKHVTGRFVSEENP